MLPTETFFFFSPLGALTNGANLESSVVKQTRFSFLFFFLNLLNKFTNTPLIDTVYKVQEFSSFKLSYNLTLKNTGLNYLKGEQIRAQSCFLFILLIKGLRVLNTISEYKRIL